MHILLLPSWYPTPTNPLVGSFFREQALALRKSGHEVGVINVNLRPWKEIKEVIKNSTGNGLAIDAGIPVISFYGLLVPKCIRLNVFLIRTIGIFVYTRYRKLFGQPDIIHVHSLKKAGIVAYAIKKKYSVPYVVTEHSSMFANRKVTREHKKILTPIVANSDYLIAVSRKLSLLLNGIFNKSKKWQVVPNIVSNQFLDYSINKGIRSGCYSFISISMLTPIKRLDLLIRAFSITFKNSDNVRLFIIGDGPEKSNLETLALENSNVSRIFFLGKLSRLQVVEKLAASDALVVSSSYETFGVVVVEALALGKPVVATRCGGPETILEPGDGILVAPNSVEELSRGMKEIYVARKTFDPENIRERCRIRFGEEAVVAQLEKIYQSVLAHK